MKRRFIVLTDLSDHSKRLLTRVHDWARKARAELLLVHQVVKAMPGFGDSEIIQSLRQAEMESAFAGLKLFAEEAAGDISDMYFHVDTMHIISMIEGLEAADTVDYLFVGLNNKPVIDRLFLGNTAAELSKQLNKIIIAFPAANNDIDVETLHVGIIEKYPLNEESFGGLMAIMAGIIKKLHFFSVIKPAESQEAAEKYLDALQACYAERVPTSYSVFRSEDPIGTVKDFMVKNRGILVMQKGSRNLLDIFRRFWTTELISMAQIPIVILPNDN
jgi:hypothetical protein